VEGWTRHQAEQDAFQGLKYNTLSADQLDRSADLKRPVIETWNDRQMDEFRQIWKEWDGYNFLCQTKLPILELWGDRGLQKRPELKSLSIPERENIQVRWILGASHLLPLERPQEVALAIADFVRYTIQK
jgi:pimeloyl-ACP methyl ester carboxylesterase